MVRISEIAWLGVVVCLMVFLLVSGHYAKADTTSYPASTRLYPSEYLLGSHDPRHDPVLDDARVIDLSAEVGIGSDCGRVDFGSTLRASLSNVLNTKYFGDMGKDILAASPMLLACYFSPTWCAILKHSQISAHWLSQMRLDQCSLIDKYTDSRVEDFYQARQACVRRSIDQNGGDLENAMQACNGNSLWQNDLANWAGPSAGGTATTNRLIDSSAQWAGMTSPDSRSSLDLVKALVGDTVVSHGTVGVEYGPHRSSLTPRTYLQSIDQTTYDKLCGGILKRIAEADPGAPLDQLFTDDDLRALSPGSDHLLVDRQTIRALVSIEPGRREMACRKLAHAVALTAFSTDINRSLDILSTLAQNPNLPDNRKREIRQKRQALKDQIELTTSLDRERNEPVNQILSQINDEGQRLETQAVHDVLTQDAEESQGNSFRQSLFDCSDNVMCETGGGHR